MINIDQAMEILASGPGTHALCLPFGFGIESYALDHMIEVAIASELTKRDFSGLIVANRSVIDDVIEQLTLLEVEFKSTKNKIVIGGDSDVSISIVTHGQTLSGAAFDMAIVLVDGRSKVPLDRYLCRMLPYRRILFLGSRTGPVDCHKLMMEAGLSPICVPYEALENDPLGRKPGERLELVTSVDVDVLPEEVRLWAMQQGLK